jgi:hypothetical protein
VGALTSADRAPTLAEIGEALYGQYWQRPMARELGRGLRTVHRWASTGYVPDGATMGRLVDLLDAKLMWANDVLARIVAHLDSGPR